MLRHIRIKKTAELIMIKNYKYKNFNASNLTNLPIIAFHA